MDMIRERDIEKAFSREARKRGVLCWKFVSPGVSGVPDRILVGDDASVVFIEFKRPGEKLRPLQLRICQKLVDRGLSVIVIDSLDAVSCFWKLQDLLSEGAESE